MAAGLQVYDAQGRITVDITGNFPKFVGQVYSGLSNGSVNVPALAQGRAFAYILPDGFSTPNRYPIYPLISVGSTTISWQFNNFSTGVFAGQRTGGTIIYGYY